MPGPARRSRRTRNEPPEIGLTTGDEGEDQSQDVQTQETMDDESHKQDPEEQNEDSDEEGRTHSQEKPRSRKRDVSSRKSAVVATTRRSNRVRKPTSRSSSRVSSPAPPGTKSKGRGRTDDQQSKDTDETHSGHASVVDEASSSSSSTSSSSEDENEDKSKHSQGNVPRRQPRRSKRARHFPTPDEPSRSEEQVDQETEENKETSRGDESSASSSPRRKKSDTNIYDNDDDNDDSSDNEPLSVLMKRKKETFKRMNIATLETDSTEGNDHSHEARPKKPLSSAASSIVDEDEGDNESGDDNVKPPNDSTSSKQRRKRQGAPTTHTDTSHRSSGDEHDANGPPLKKTRRRKILSSKKPVSDPSTNDELSSDESVVKGGRRSTRSRRRKEADASRPLPSTIQEQDENDDDHDKSTNIEVTKIAEEKEVSNDDAKPIVDDDGESKRGKKRSDSHADDEASEEMVGTLESSRRSQRTRRKPRKLGGGESSDDENMVIMEESGATTELVKEEDSQEVTSEPQEIEARLSNMEPSRQVETADIDKKDNKLGTEDDAEVQSSVRDSGKEVTEQKADDNEQIEAPGTTETKQPNRENRGNGEADRDHVMDVAETSESTNDSIEKDIQIGSGSAVAVEGECEESQSTKCSPEQSASETSTKINQASQSTVNIEMSGADLSTQADTLSDVANNGSSEQKDKASLDAPEATTSHNNQDLDYKSGAPSVLPTASLVNLGEDNQIASYDFSPIHTDAQSQPNDETKPVRQQIEDEGSQTVNSTESIGEGQLQGTESLISKIETSGETHVTAVPLDKDSLTVPSNDREPNSEIRNIADSESMNLTSHENTGAELDASSLRKADENEQMNEREPVDLPDDSKSGADAGNDRDSPITGVSPSERDDNDLRVTGDDGVGLNEKGETVGELRREEIMEPTRESEENATKISKKDDDGENDHFHDAQMELPPEPHMSLKLDPTQSETNDKIMSQGQQTVVDESLEKESEPNAQVTARTENETLDEGNPVAYSNSSILETSAITEGSRKEQQVDASPIPTVEVPHADLEIGAVVTSPALPLVASLDKTNSVVGHDFNTIAGKEMIGTDPQIPQEVSSQEKAEGKPGSHDSCSMPSDDGMAISIIPTIKHAQTDEHNLRAQEGAAETSISLLHPQPLNTDLETKNEEQKTREEAVSTENLVKDVSTAAAESSDQDMSPKAATDPQAYDETNVGPSKPTTSPDSTEPHILPKIQDMDASAPMASPASLIVEDVHVENDGSSAEAKQPASQSLGTDGDPHSASDTKNSPDFWALPFDLDYKVKFGPPVPPVSKMPSKTGVNGMDAPYADKIKRVKAALYAAGSNAHRGAGFERIFSEYWDAMALRLSDRLSSHTSERCQKAIDNFLTTSKLRKLHNRFVLSILRRASKSMAVYDEISSHLPSKWRNRIRIICDKTSDPPGEQLNASGLQTNDAYERMEPVYREAWHQDQPDPKPIGNETRRQKTVVGPKHEVASCSIPGALTVDPLVRKIAEECDMQVSELAVWMMVVAVREHATNVLRAALSQKEGMEQQELVPRTLRFPNFLANATKPPPKKDTTQELGKPSTAEKAARAQRKLTVLDVYAGSSTMPCGNVGSLGGSLSRDVLERSLHAAFDHLPLVPKDDFVQVQHFITEQIFGEARTRKVPTKPRDDERETRTDDINRNSNITMKQRNSFAVPAPAPAQTRQPQVLPQPPVAMAAPQQATPVAVKETTQQDLNADASSEENSGQKSLPRGMGRGAKDLAALMRRTSTSTSPVQENVLKETDGTVLGGEATVTTTPEETLADSGHAPSLEESGVDGEDPMGQRRGKGFGIKNLAAMRARAGNNDS